MLTAEAIFGGNGVLLWAIVLAVLGFGLLWRQADEAQRSRWLDQSEKLNPVRAVFGGGGWAAYVRVGAGFTLIVGAMALFAVRHGHVRQVTDVLFSAALGGIGLAIMLGPWVWRLTSDLSDERAERVRTQERADLAAHLHDSVLQTLALIQKNAADAPTVARLARSQERDLRAWLFDATPGGGTLAGCAAGGRPRDRGHLRRRRRAGHGRRPRLVGTRRWPRSWRPRARPPPTPPSTPARPVVDIYAEVSPRPGRGVRARPRRRLRPAGRARPTGRASATASWTG